MYVFERHGFATYFIHTCLKSLSFEWLFNMPWYTDDNGLACKADTPFSIEFSDLSCCLNSVHDRHWEICKYNLIGHVKTPCLNYLIQSFLSSDAIINFANNVNPKPFQHTFHRCLAKFFVVDDHDSILAFSNYRLQVAREVWWVYQFQVWEKIAGFTLWQRSFLWKLIAFKCEGKLCAFLVDTLKLYRAFKLLHNHFWDNQSQADASSIDFFWFYRAKHLEYSALVLFLNTEAIVFHGYLKFVLIIIVHHDTDFAVSVCEFHCVWQYVKENLLKSFHVWVYQKALSAISFRNETIKFW